MSKETNKERIKVLKQKIKYENKKMKCCAYSSSDLKYLCELESELERLQSQI